MDKKTALDIIREHCNDLDKSSKIFREFRLGDSFPFTKTADELTLASKELRLVIEFLSSQSEQKEKNDKKLIKVKRYVNIYKDHPADNGRLGHMHSIKEDALRCNLSLRGQTHETVRILNEQEEKEFAWEWFQKRTLMIREKCNIYPLPINDHLREEFEKLWAEGEKE